MNRFVCFNTFYINHGLFFFPLRAWGAIQEEVDNHHILGAITKWGWGVGVVV